MAAKRRLGRNQAHVYFYSLPVGERFVHKGKAYVKTGEESARSLDGPAPRSGGGWLFEIHYGAVIPKARATALRLPATAHRPL